MSGRTYAQIKTATWTDDDYRELPQASKALYVAMLSHPSLNGLGVGIWDLREFTAFDPDTTEESVLSARAVLVDRRYVVIDDDASRYAIRSYLRTNSHLINNSKNAKGLVNAYQATFSKVVRHSALHELHRLRDEHPSSVGWPILRELFDTAKFDFTKPPTGVRSLVGSPARSPVRSTDRGESGSTDRSPVGSPAGSPVGSISTQYSVLDTQNPLLDKSSEGADSKVDGGPEGFDAFWDAYDKKVDKKEAIAKYKLALKKPGITPEFLLTTATEYITWQKTEGKHPDYTKNPSGWLLKEKWNDERAPRTSTREAGGPPATGGLPHWTEIEEPDENWSDEEVAQWAEQQGRKRGGSDGQG